MIWLTVIKEMRARKERLSQAFGGRIQVEGSGRWELWRSGWRTHLYLAFRGEAVMKFRGRGFVIVSAVLLSAAVMLNGARALGQNSGGHDSELNLALHANSHATATDVGLPAYPGATPYRVGGEGGDKNNDPSLDLGFAFGDFHFSVIVASYETNDSPEQVLNFYRKPLSRYGEVLECDHGNPVGKMTTTSTGLTCSNDHGGHVQVNGSANSSDDLELRAGTPHKYRIVGIDDSKAGKTHFGLVYLELPKDTGQKAE
jgi:hypothetical protein